MYYPKMKISIIIAITEKISILGSATMFSFVIIVFAYLSGLLKGGFLRFSYYNLLIFLELSVVPDSSTSPNLSTQQSK